MNAKAICAEFEYRIDKRIPRTITEHSDHTIWRAEYKDYFVQVTFHVDGRVKMEYSIPKADVHYFAPDEMSETREIWQRWEVDIMPVVVGTICPLDELRNAVLEDQWRAQNR